MGPCLLIHGECLAAMADLPAGSVDMVLTDLPYGTTANKWDAVIPFAPMWEQFLRIGKENAAFVLTASQPFTSALVMSRVDLFKAEWIWEKNNATGHLNAKKVPMKKHENVLVFARGKPTYNPQGLVPFNKTARRASNGGCYGAAGKECFQEVTNYPRTILGFDSQRGAHPTQKPVELMRYMIRTYTNAGDTVLDATMGSGTTGVAAIAEGRHFVGIEQSDEYFPVARDRMAAAWAERCAELDVCLTD